MLILVWGFSAPHISTDKEKLRLSFEVAKLTTSDSNASDYTNEETDNKAYLTSFEETVELPNEEADEEPYSISVENTWTNLKVSVEKI